MQRRVNALSDLESERLRRPIPNLYVDPGLRLGRQMVLPGSPILARRRLPSRASDGESSLQLYGGIHTTIYVRIIPRILRAIDLHRQAQRHHKIIVSSNAKRPVPFVRMIVDLDFVVE